jgi:hypothetical protein
MGGIPVADLAETDYPEFYRICEGRMPSTYGAWWWEQAAKYKDDVASGQELMRIRVTPGELQQFCKDNRRLADREAIRLLVEKKFFTSDLFIRFR